MSAMETTRQLVPDCAVLSAGLPAKSCHSRTRSMANWLLLLFAVLAVGVWLLRPRRRTLPATPRAQMVRPTSKYHCVAIKYRDGACQSVKKLESTRFFPKEAPQFPLPDCGARPCRCSYVHFDDRRASERRTPYRSAILVPYLGQDLRSGGGRRLGEGRV